MSDQIDPKVLAALLRKPEGEGGIKVAEMLNKTNRYITSFTYRCLEPKDGQTILEIGFGNGILMPELMGLASNLKVYGVDFAADMVLEAKKYLKEQLENGLVHLSEASVENLPFAENTFDSACSINTLYFWPEPLENSREVLRVLKPGGKVFIGIRPKEDAKKVPATQFGFQLYERQEAMELLENTGFADVHIKEQTDPPVEFKGEMKVFDSWVVIGTKP